MSERETGAPVTAAARSEFGAGVVVCLAKFSEHLWTGKDEAVRELWRVRANPQEREALSPTAAHQLDFAERWWREHPEYRRAESPLDAAISAQIEIWANGASDHFYDLDEDRAPAPLKELAALMLRIGHGFSDEQWTMETMDRIRELWRDSCLAVDRMLGADPDWGEY